jgi:Kef-type K+ transport system membrane component KefB
MSADVAVDRGRRLWQALFYLLMLGGAAALFLLIRAHGEAIPAAAVGAAAPAEAPGAPKVDAVFHVLLALVVVMAVGQVLARLFVVLGQPPVIGEVVGGILLGPSLLGWLWPAGYAYLLPPAVAPYLGVVAQLGVILYMFLVGLELNAGLLRRQAYAAVTISHAGIVFPFLLGAALALPLYPRLAGPGVPFTSFALFLGVALAITAFPVLARILTDRGLTRTELGALALSCAAAGDVTAWCLLALVVGVARAELGAAALVLAGSAAYLAVMFLAVRPLAARFAARCDKAGLSRGAFALVLAALVLSALATDAIGIHALFGAFLLGAVVPHDSALAREFTRRTEDLVTVLLLPAFFAFTGLRTEVGLLSGAEDWLVCVAITLVATAGKYGGSLVAARLAGLPWRTATALGALMNTRGLMELIVLNVGLDLKVISPALFAMMVLMALATTLATAPVLHLLTARRARPAHTVW